MPTVDLTFPVMGGRVPTDHGYALYGAISRLIDEVHAGALPLAICPLTGSYAGEGQLMLEPKSSRLRVRLSSDHIPALLKLTGKELDVAGSRVLLGAPSVHLLTPAPVLVARCVTIKNATDEGRLLEAARRELDALGIAAQVEVPRVAAGARAGSPRRVVLRVAGRAVVGFTLLARGLSGPDSIRLQEVGLGGRRRMGAGVFNPAEGEG